MQCPECGYLISDLDEECPRCHGLGSAAVYKHQRSRPALVRPRVTPKLTPAKTALILAIMMLPVIVAVFTCLAQVPSATPPAPGAPAPQSAAVDPTPPAIPSAEDAATEFVRTGAGGSGRLEVREGTVASHQAGEREWVVTGRAAGVTQANAASQLEWTCRMRRTADGTGWEVVEHDVSPAK